MEVEDHQGERAGFVEGGGFSVRDVPASIEGLADDDALLISDDCRSEVSSAVDSKVNGMLVDTVCVVVSKLAVAITGFGEIGLDDDEREQLVALWAPLMPGMSPFANAVLGTVLILSSKTFLYLHLRKQSKSIETAKIDEEGKDA